MIVSRRGTSAVDVQRKLVHGVNVMRISDLSRESGVPVATIKFYLREQLLPAGQPTGRNQALYSDRHLRRLRLIRAFTGVAQLDLTSVRELLAVIDDEEMPLPAVFDAVNEAVGVTVEPPPSLPRSVRVARDDVDGFLGRLGWNVREEAPGREELASVLAALRRLGCDCTMDYFDVYAETAERVARAELDLLDQDNPDHAAAVARNVLLEVALSAMRRMAQEHLVAERFGAAAAG
jgi:DNA-binding transcriptional MerR regulator